MSLSAKCRQNRKSHLPMFFDGSAQSRFDLGRGAALIAWTAPSFRRQGSATAAGFRHLARTWRALGAHLAPHLTKAKPRTQCLPAIKAAFRVASQNEAMGME
jgi:hypothetical protein